MCVCVCVCVCVCWSCFSYQTDIYSRTFISLPHYPRVPSRPDNGESAVSTTRVTFLYISDTVNNSVALVRERTISTERPPPVGEVSATFCG